MSTEPKPTPLGDVKQQRNKLIDEHPRPELILRGYEQFAQYHQAFLVGAWGRLSSVLIINFALVGGYVWSFNRYAEYPLHERPLSAILFHLISFLAWLVASACAAATLRGRVLHVPRGEQSWVPKIQKLISDFETQGVLSSDEAKRRICNYTIKTWCQNWADISGSLNRANQFRAKMITGAIWALFIAVPSWAIGSILLIILT